MSTTLQLRRGTAAGWTGADPTLAAGEPGYETDTGKLKVGDGATAWTGLAYFGGGAGIVFDAVNTGGFLTIEAPDPDADSYGIQLHETGTPGATSGILIHSDEQGVNLVANNNSARIESDVNYIEADFSAGITARIKTGLSLTLLDNGFGTRMRVAEDGSVVEFKLGAGGTFTLLDSGGNPMLQMTEGSPDLHLPTGGAVVFDL